jgi:arylsulfatase A-like enzyme
LPFVFLKDCRMAYFYQCRAISSTYRLVLAACLLFAGCGMARGAAAGRAAPRRPNFVFVYTDDQRWDAMGVVQREQGDRARFPWLRTPHMDRLATEGVRFSNAFVVNALCAPSRASFLTGRYGQLNGIVNNHTPFAADSVTHATLLRQAGYRTGYFGKWHMGNQRGQRPGFDFSASFVGQGVYFDCPIEVNGERTPSTGWVDDVTTDYAVRFIRESKDSPFSLVLGYKAAHGPFQPPPRRRDDYQAEVARAVPNLSTPAIYTGRTPAAAPLPPRPTNLNYFRCLTAADDNLGRVLDALDQAGVADDTCVVFASDNGFYLGEHGLGDKRSAYDESMRIPLLVRYPRLTRKARVLDNLALNIDLAPTLLDLAGVTAPPEMQGKSWKPLLQGKTAGWRSAFWYTYFYENGFRIPTVTAVRTDRAKLIRYPGHPEWDELFDLRADPYETRNLIREEAAARLRGQLESAYERESQAAQFRIPLFADVPGQEPPTAPAAGRATALRATVLEYRFETDEGDRVADLSGRSNHGTAHGAPLAEAPGGLKARRFDGQGYLAIAKSPSLNPAGIGWSIDVTFRADKLDGVLIAYGGQSNGYCLHLEDGKPVFTVMAAGNPTRLVGATPVRPGEWTTLSARITAGRELTLALSGHPAGRLPLPAFIPREPNDALQVGTDLNSRVVTETPIPPFNGLVSHVRLFSGEAP